MVQTWLAARVTAYLENELNTKVHIDKVHYNLYDAVYLEGFYIEDLHGDTLLYVSEMNVSLEKLDFNTRDIIISEVKLNSPVIGIKQYENEEDLNFQFIVDYFEDKDTTKSQHPWKARVNRIKLNGANFAFIDKNKNSSVYGVDFDDIHLKDMTLNVEGFHQKADTTFFNLKELAFRDHSGFKLSGISAKASISDTKLELKKFALITEYSSVITDQLKFEYKSFEDFNDFVEKVKITSQIYPSSLHLSDLAYFVPELEGIYQNVELKGKIKGRINNLKIRELELKLSDSVYFKGDIAIEGLPDFDNALIALQIDELMANRDELVLIELPPYDGSTFLDLPFNLDYFGQISGKGNMIGTINDFVAYTEFKTEIGSLKTDLHFYLNTDDDLIHYNGDLITSNFNMGKFFDEPKLGSISANLKIKARGFDEDDLHAYVEGEISEITLAEYTYHNIKLKGDIESDFFDGSLNLHDPNIDLDYKGYINFGYNPVYRFDASLKNVAVNKIHLAELTGQEYFNRADNTILCATMNANAEGSGLKDFRGKVNIWDLSIYENGVDYDLKYIKLTARNIPRSTDKMFELASPQFIIHATGDYTFDNVFTHFNNLAAEIVPTYVKKVPFKEVVNENFRFGFDFIDISSYTKLFFPNVEIANRTNLAGNYNSKTEDFNFDFYSKRIFYDGHLLEDFSLKGLKSNVTNDKVNLDLEVKNYASPGSDSTYQNINFSSIIDSNFVSANLNWKNKDGAFEGEVVADILIKSLLNFEIELKPSYAQIDGDRWDMKQKRCLEIDSTHCEFIDDIEFVNGKQKIGVKGIIAENDFEQLNFRIENLRMDNFSYMNSDSSRVDFFGEINGKGFARNLYKSIILEANLNIDSLGVNKELIGDLVVSNILETDNKRLASKGKLVRNGMPALDLSGYYYMEKEKENLDYTFKFTETNLAFLNAFLPPDISHFNSLASGVVKLKGSTNEPKIGGSLKFENGAVKVNMLNTSYFFGGVVNIDDDMIYFDRLPIEDVRGNKAEANGTIIHKNFSNWNYDFFIQFEKLLCLNTTEELNNLYYGKAYASGDIEVEGYGDKINIEVRAKSEKGTKVVLPLYGASEVSVSDFVTFVTEDTTKVEKKEVSLDGITMIFELDVTPDAEVKIVFNKTAGDEMVGRGDGHLQMVIDPLGDFNMYGQYVIDDAFYRFTLLDVVNKNFDVRKGGTISWYGDPYNADLNLQAVYKVKTSLFDIMPSDVADNYRKATDINCIMNFKNSLYAPEISFDIEVPKADENAKSMINSIRSSNQELSKQFFSLMVINKFMPLGNNGNRETTNASAFSTPSELLSSQLSNWLSQISDEFDIGINYRPGTNITGEQIEVAFSTQFFDDRVTLSTNVGVSQGSSFNPNNQLIGDFNVEVKLDQDGNMRLRGFNESNQFDIANVTQAPFTQGVGVFYTEEFDKMNETKTWLLLRGIFDKEAREERKKIKAEKKRKKAERKALEELDKTTDDDTHDE